MLKSKFYLQSFYRYLNSNSNLTSIEPLCSHWKLTHEPHTPNIRKTDLSSIEDKQHCDDTLPVNNWDWWFETKNYSLMNFTLKRSVTSDDLPLRKMRYQNLPKRNWTTTDYKQRIKNSHFEHFSFRILSYNILAQQLIQDNRNLYSYCTNYDLDWLQRRDRLLDEIIYHNADIVCLQEMQDWHYYNEFQPRLEQFGYGSIYIKRSGYKTDGCALFYRVNRLRLVRSKCVPFYQRNIEVLNRENCGLIALFQPIDRHSTENDRFCVANTHLLFSPKRGDIKLAQIQYFLAEIDRLSLKSNYSDNDYHPIILCGDFNAQPQSPLARFLVDGHIQYDNYRRIEISGQIPLSFANQRYSLQLPSTSLLPLSFVRSDCRFPDSTREMEYVQSASSSAVLTHNKQFRSVYDMDDVSKVTTRIDHDSGLVDYIYYTRSNNDRNRLNLLARYELYDRDIVSYVHLPNRQFPSDHFLLAADFALKLHRRKKPR